MTRYPNDELELPSGKIVSANCGIIGIGPNLNLSGGYDDGIPCVSNSWHDEKDPFSETLSKAEVVDLADIMIARWQAFRAKNLP